MSSKAITREESTLLLSSVTLECESIEVHTLHCTVITNCVLPAPVLLQVSAAGVKSNLMKLHILTCVCCRGVVEYDAEGFTKLTLLLMWKDFCFLVHGKELERHSHWALFQNAMPLPDRPYPRLLLLCFSLSMLAFSLQWICRCTSPGTSPPSPSSLCTTSPTAVSFILRCRSHIPTAHAGTAMRWPREQSK